jgi:hypothetical protein
LGVHHQTVQRCVERALAYGPIAALDDRQRPGRALYALRKQTPEPVFGIIKSVLGFRRFSYQPHEAAKSARTPTAKAHSYRLLVDRI